MTKFEKAKNWIKENKYEIAEYACYAAAAVSGGVLICKSVKAYRAAKLIKELPIPENWGHGKVTWLLGDPTGVMGHVADIPVEQLPTVGESLVKPYIYGRRS